MIRAAALITSAGSSNRMGSGKKKEYQFINGKSVLEMCLSAFHQTGHFHQYIVTVPQGQIPQAKELIKSLDIPILFIEGGETRQESVYNGLKALENESIDIVLIHDGARPWVSGNLINNVFSAAAEHNACIPVVEIPDAPKQVDETGFIVFHHRKHTLFGAQTPQGFSYPLILQAHEKAAGRDELFADDAKVFELIGKRVFTMPGEYTNRKITYAHDLEGA